MYYSQELSIQFFTCFLLFVCCYWCCFLCFSTFLAKILFQSSKNTATATAALEKIARTIIMSLLLTLRNLLLPGTINQIHFYRVHGKTTDEWHTNDIQGHTIDIRITYEHILVTYGWHTSTYEWHTDDIQVHTSDIRMTYEYVWMSYEYIRVIYEWHTSDMRMTCGLKEKWS